MTAVSVTNDRRLVIPDRRAVFHAIAGRPSLEYFLYRPSTEVRGAPLAVAVHGIARNAAAHAYRLMSDAERCGISVVAPLFEKQAFGQYQQLRDRHSGARSDEALLAIIDDAARRSFADPSRILLFGFSGGAQFSHRFAMAHPTRVLSAVIAAAGWYTLPVVEAPYPYGLDTSAWPLGVILDPHAFARVRFHVLVGQLDVERDSSVRRSTMLDTTQGRTRVARARTWVEAMSRLAAAVPGASTPTLTVLSGVGHSFTECAERAGLSRLVFQRFIEDAALMNSARA